MIPDPPNWHVTDTVHADRKNLFALAASTPYHVGTVTSGSRSKLDQFEADVALMATAPAMLEALCRVAEFLKPCVDRGDPVAADLLALVEVTLNDLE